MRFEPSASYGPPSQLGAISECTASSKPRALPPGLIPPPPQIKVKEGRQEGGKKGERGRERERKERERDLVVLRAHSWLCIQELLLALYGMLGIEPWSATGCSQEISRVCADMGWESPADGRGKPGGWGFQVLLVPRLHLRALHWALNFLTVESERERRGGVSRQQRL